MMRQGSRGGRFGCGLAVLALVLLAQRLAAGAEDASAAGATAGGGSRFITLGTNSGPIPNPRRAEASNVLLYGDQVVVVDAGDGVAWQLARAGVTLDKVDAIVLSHLHFDHTGGLFALMAQRFQMNIPDPFTIYGPQGTQQTVDALVQAMAPVLDEHGWMLAKVAPKPAEVIEVVELTHGATFDLGGARVTVSRNSHYIVAEEQGDTRVRGLSFRFDLPDRSIVYTGDTGPSADVVKLAQDADLLVTEIMDPEVAWERIEALAEASDPGLFRRIGMQFASGAIKEHFRRQHLSPEEVGTLAAQSKVKTLVITHNAIPDELLGEADARVRKHFSGDVLIAEDLQAF